MRPPYSSFHCQTRRSNSSRPERYASQPFFSELPLHHHLRGDAGVIGAGKPERVLAVHPMPADGHVDYGVVEHVADVERAGYVGRRDNERKYRPVRVSISPVKILVDPPLGPMRLKSLGLIDFLEVASGNFRVSYRLTSEPGLGASKCGLMTLYRHGLFAKVVGRGSSRADAPQ